MHRRKLEELNLLDDFLIFTLVNHPKYGKQFSRKLLKIILGKEFKKLKVIPQKVYYGSDTDKHGARLDVYLEEELDGEEHLESATICDVEPEQNDSRENIESLPRRVRFYHSKIDVGSLESGADYQTLKNVIVILIMPYDPFGLNRMVYTIRNGCVEEPEMPYDDGAKTIFLYTNGTEGNPTEELSELLHYMTETKRQNAQNDTLKEIHEMVESVKRDAEVSLAYMRMMKSKEELIREERWKIKELERKLEEAEESRREAEERWNVIVQKKLERGDSVEKIAEDLLEDEAFIREVINRI